MTNPLLTLKRLFEGTPDVRRDPHAFGQRFEKNFMKYDLTTDIRF